VITNVFDWLDSVERRPGMFLGDRGLEELETLLWGYEAALGVHSIDEGVPRMGRHFLEWMGWRTHWSMACGWADAVASRFDGLDAQLRYFFERVREYRALRPTAVCSVALEARHQPTGKRLVIGFGQGSQAPEAIDIVQDAPLHFLRFRYRERLVVEGLLQVNRPDGSLDIETSLDDARAWVQAEFQVRPDEWI
jgi:hypothetical protein